MKHSILGSRRRTFTLLRVFAISLIVAALTLGVALASPAQAVSYSAEEIAFVQMLNDYRADKGLDALLVSDLISEACDRHNSDMGKYAFFDHYTTGGSDWFEIGASPWDRMAASGYTFNTHKGENIAAGYGTAAEVFTGWKNSAGHNANMLGTNFEVLGVSVVKVTGSKYGYYWTTDFGGYADDTAHSVGSGGLPTTTTTAEPTTTTTRRVTTTTSSTTTTTVYVRPTTTTTSSTTTTKRPTTTTTARPTTTTTVRPTTTTTVAQTTGFVDVNDYTAYAAEIRLLAGSGVVSGYQDGSFGPYNKVTRQQFAKMIVLALDYDVSPLSACAFKDVSALPGSSDPLYPGGYIAACAAAGITVGKTPDTFAPYEQITRAQLITMVARAAELSDPPAGYQPQFDNFSGTHYPWARRAAYAGLLDGLLGIGPGYDFWATATRGEVCLLLANMLGR
jgi:uncharacterized protein YkwD